MGGWRLIGASAIARNPMISAIRAARGGQDIGVTGGDPAPGSAHTAETGVRRTYALARELLSALTARQSAIEGRAIRLADMA